MNNTIRSSAIRYALTTAAAVVMLGSFAATSAFAQNLTRADVRAQVIAAQGEGTLGSVAAPYGYDTAARPITGASRQTRAQVTAATEHALADGEIDAQLGESYGAKTPVAAGATSREQVKAAAARALRDGTINAQLGESYDSRMLPVRAARAL
ncbi:hypothetical protein [Xylophilus sp. GOD-11R]|uniref:hypothetical protein n=1 Tax=Xylophilus sp. GOD-11R TaxID=3089814 RepID=UPI00298CA4E2|nr:hypothetical protein [Xylophilus sp. GOD-11R]WPB55388.1 hypothetical protein R9X41_14695 [Xylophilus sp. GOD-11R]